jgi:MFS superfamily sulfate permease-like transporter
MYFIFGASPHAIVGPTAIGALLTNNYLKAHPDVDPLEGTVLLSFLSGLVLIVLSFVRAGFLARLISKPVLVGFTSAASLLIAMSQVKYTLGITMDSSYNVIQFFKALAPAIHEISWWYAWIFVYARLSA